MKFKKGDICVFADGSYPNYWFLVIKSSKKHYKMLNLNKLTHRSKHVQIDNNINHKLFSDIFRNELK